MKSPKKWMAKSMEVIPFLNTIILNNFNKNFETSSFIPSHLELDNLLVFLMFCTFHQDLELCGETTVAETNTAEFALASKGVFGYNTKDEWSGYCDL